MIFDNYTEIVMNADGDDSVKKKRDDALVILDAALEAVNPVNAMARVLNKNKIELQDEEIDTHDFDDIYLVAFGKASIGMTQAILKNIDVTKGTVIINDTKGSIDDESIDVVFGAHPIPDKKNIESTELLIQNIKQCKRGDLLIILISGGGSSLLCRPRISLSDLQNTTDILLKSGKEIEEINTVRKHLSKVKGGQLIRDVPCKVVTFIISDVISDPLSAIASGPTSPDPTTFKDAEEILHKNNLWDVLPNSIHEIISKGRKGKIPETLKEGDEAFNEVINQVIASSALACKAAIDKAESLGYDAELLTTGLTGEAKKVGYRLVTHARDLKKEGIIYIASGETTVSVTGPGYGGRNQELVLGGVDALAGTDMILASFATDGIDGKSDAAGAIADGHTLDRAKQIGLDPYVYLRNNDSAGFFGSLDDLLLTGPTGTNVMDIQVIIK